MTIRRTIARPYVAMAIAAVGAAICQPVHADTSDEPFALRVFLTLDRQSNYATTLGRQASVAALDGASVNPAGAGMRAKADSPASLTASYVDVPAASGRRIVAAPLTARWPVADGSFYAAYAYTDTPAQTGDDGFNRALRSHELSGGYTFRAADNVALGLSARLVAGRIVDDDFATEVGGAPVRAVSDIAGGDVTAGASALLAQDVSAGIVLSAGWTEATTRITNLVPLVFQSPIGNVVVPEGSVLDRFDDRFRVFIVRAGVGHQWRPDVGLYADVSYARIASGRVGSLDITRGAFGVEYSPSQPWSLRAGVGVDNNGETTWSAGFGYRVDRNVEAQFAYQLNASPEVNPEFGRTRLIVASIAARI